MPPLRRHRRDHRARAPKRRKRRNLVKFIPEADSDFAFTAGNFVSLLRREPGIYNVTAEKLADIEKVVKQFRDALAKLGMARHGAGPTPQLIRTKDEARAKAEDVVRTFANIIRADPNVPANKKTLLRIKVRPKRLGKKKCPQAPPMLQFLGSGDGVVGGITLGSGSGVHVLRFLDDSNGGLTIGTGTMMTIRRARPDGAARLELYFDMIPPGEPVPRLPNERGWPKYLRSFTRSPMEVQFPIPVGGDGPMLIVYWARWADSSGEVSRWSKPCVARVEGWTPHNVHNLHNALPAADVKAVGTHRVETKYVYIQTPIAGELPAAGGVEGDQEANAFGRHLLEHGMARLLDSA